MRNITIALILAGCILFAGRIHSQTQITFYTTMGDFVVEMTDSLTPITSGNFISLTMQEFYDGVIFHRVISNFVVQGGDPTGTGYGGPGYAIPDEFDSTLSNVTGTISMANSGPNTGGSQFFFNLVNNTHLDFDKPPYTSKHPVFGWVISGWPVVVAIGNVAVNSANKPLTDVVMDSLRVTKWNPVSTSSLPKNTAALSVYPNPAEDYAWINIEHNLVEAPEGTLRIMNSAGQLISATPIAQGNSRQKINTSELSSGLYLLSLTLDSGQTSFTKLLVK